MTALHTHKTSTLTIDMARDDVRVIDSRGGGLEQIKKAFAKLHRITDKMPISKATAADFKKSRDSRGKA